MTRPRLVATDLDGTLLRTDGTISEHTADVLRGVLDLGVDVAFVTARPPPLDRPTSGPTSAHAAWRSCPTGRCSSTSPPGRRSRYGRRDRSRPRPHRAPPRGPAGGALRGGDDRRHRPRAGYLEPGHAPTGQPDGSDPRVWTAPALKLLARHEHLDPEVLREQVFATVGDSAVADLDGGRPGGDQRRRRHQGRRAGPVVTRLGIDPTESWSSATCRTTSRC